MNLNHLQLLQIKGKRNPQLLLPDCRKIHFLQDSHSLTWGLDPPSYLYEVKRKITSNRYLRYFGWYIGWYCWVGTTVGKIKDPMITGCKHYFALVYSIFFSFTIKLFPENCVRINFWPSKVLKMDTSPYINIFKLSIPIGLSSKKLAHI